MRRIQRPRVVASVEALHSLHTAHVRAIPFENVDVILVVLTGEELDRLRLVLGQR